MSVICSRYGCFCIFAQSRATPLTREEETLNLARAESSN